MRGGLHPLSGCKLLFQEVWEASMETPASSKRLKDPQARREAPLWVRGEHGNGERTVPAQWPASPSASGISPRVAMGTGG